MWETIDRAIGQALGTPFTTRSRRSVSGGDINQSHMLLGQDGDGGDRQFFVKLNQAARLPMFEAEQLGLVTIAQTHTIGVPMPIAVGVAASSCYLVLAWLDFGRGQSQSWTQMGQQLAQLHNYPGSTAFGWSRENTIGATPQPNPWTTDWIEFWQVHRIGFQLQRAAQKGARFAQADRLLAAIPDLLADHSPQPSIVHGDLWSGNAAILADGTPTIFDPALYWGDREVDLAMTELFGGFPQAFYVGYGSVWPTRPGYERRKILYNLYHILNHYNLFGGGYAAQADRMIAELLN
jgi:fructosamine-3-kinase